MALGRVALKEYVEAHLYKTSHLALERLLLSTAPPPTLEIESSDCLLWCTQQAPEEPVLIFWRDFLQNQRSRLFIWKQKQMLKCMNAFLYF